jgi:hypothetical protein
MNCAFLTDLCKASARAVLIFSIQVLRFPTVSNDFNEVGSWDNSMPSVGVSPPSCGSKKVDEAQAAPTASGACRNRVVTVTQI